jgi:hypothetical protein
MLPYFGPEFTNHLLAKCNGVSSEAEDAKPQAVVTDTLTTPRYLPGPYFWRYSQSFIVVAQLIRAWLM